MDWPLTIAALNVTAAAMALGAAAWMHAAGPMPGRGAFVLTQLAIAWWAGTASLEIALTDPGLRLMVGQVQYLGIAVLPVAWLHFAAAYARHPVAQHRGLLITTVIPAITVVLALTHGWQTWLWTDVRPAGPNGFALEFVRGPWFWVNWIHTNLLLIVSSVWMVRALVRYRSAYAVQTLSFLVGLLLPWAANLLTILGVITVPGLDLTPSAFALTGACFAFGLLWYQR